METFTTIDLTNTAAKAIDYSGRRELGPMALVADEQTAVMVVTWRQYYSPQATGLYQL